MFENVTEQAQERVIRREVARLETWLACYALDQRRNPRSSIAPLFDACSQTLATQRASELGL